jgi:hypothetical protein
VPAAPSWAWPQGALILAGAAQLITISALNGADLLPAIAPAPLAAVLVLAAGVDHVKEQLTGLLDLEGARFEYGSRLGHPPRLEPDGTVIAGHAQCDVEQQGLAREEIEVRAFGNGQYYGRFMLRAKPDSKPSLQARLVAVTLADQAGRALAAGETTRSPR